MCRAKQERCESLSGKIAPDRRQSLQPSLSVPSFGTLIRGGPECARGLEFACTSAERGCGGCVTKRAKRSVLVVLRQDELLLLHKQSAGTINTQQQWLALLIDLGKWGLANRGKKSLKV